MKKLLLTASAFALVAVLSAPAHAECDGFYGALRAGVVQHDVSDDSAVSLMSSDESLDDNRLMISGALGYRYKHFRGELEYVWRKHTKDEEPGFDIAKFKSYSYMLNAYWDFMPYHWWSPYVNAGIGLTQLKYSNIDTSAGGLSNTTDGNYEPMNFTWSVGAGLSLKVTNRLNVDAGYRYFDMGGIRHADVTAQEVYGGLRYVF